MVRVSEDCKTEWFKKRSYIICADQTLPVFLKLNQLSCKHEGSIVRLSDTWITRAQNAFFMYSISVNVFDESQVNELTLYLYQPHVDG